MCVVRDFGLYSLSGFQRVISLDGNIYNLYEFGCRQWFFFFFFNILDFYFANPKGLLKYNSFLENCMRYELYIYGFKSCL